MLFDFVMQGRFDPVGGKYFVEVKDSESQDSEISTVRELAGKTKLRRKWQERCFACSDYICYPRISGIHFASFFNLCRLERVSYDIRNKLGTVFMLIDSL